MREPAPRLALMDEQGIDKSMMYPTLASLVEERFREHPEATHTIIHGLNQWLHETWSFDYKGRIFTTPIITLPIVERAIGELNWVVERGARAILIRPAPVPGLHGPRSFALPEFDPFWKRVVETGVLVIMHASDSGYSRYANEWEGSGEFRPFQPSPFRSYYSLARNPAEDAVAALACHGLLTRFPELRIGMVENGTTWLPRLLENLSDIRKKMPQLYGEDPWRRSVAASISIPSGKRMWPSSRSWCRLSTCSSAGTTRIPRAWPNRSATPIAILNWATTKSRS